MKCRFLIPVIAAFVVTTLTWQKLKEPQVSQSTSVAKASVQKAPSQNVAEIQLINPEKDLDYPGEVEIYFPNGEIVSIILHTYPGDSVASQTELLDNYHYYRDLAMEGNGTVGFRLYNVLRACKSQAYDDPEELDAAIDTMYQSRQVPQGPDRPTLYNDSMNLEMFEQGLRQHSRSCSKITNEDYEDSRLLLEAAAASNYMPAIITFANHFQFMQPESIDTLDHAWRLGNIHSLHQLSQIYDRGVEGVEPDPIKSFAYIYLHSHLRIQDAQMYAPGGQFAERIMASRKNYLKYRAHRLHAYQVNEGIELARQLLLENANCCASTYR